MQLKNKLDCINSPIRPNIVDILNSRENKDTNQRYVNNIRRRILNVLGLNSSICETPRALQPCEQPHESQPAERYFVGFCPNNGATRSIVEKEQFDQYCKDCNVEVFPKTSAHSFRFGEGINQSLGTFAARLPIKYTYFIDLKLQ